MIAKTKGRLRSVEKWTPENLAWLAGLIEGEGCINFSDAKGVQFNRVSVDMTDKDVIERILDIAGCGTMVGPYAYKLSTKEIWRWHVQNAPAVKALLTVLYPRLGLRRRAKIEELFARRWPDSVQLKGFE